MTAVVACEACGQRFASVNVMGPHRYTDRDGVRRCVPPESIGAIEWTNGYDGRPPRRMFHMDDGVWDMVVGDDEALVIDAGPQSELRCYTIFERKPKAGGVFDDGEAAIRITGTGVDNYTRSA